jgi:hypothetical protein
MDRTVHFPVTSSRLLPVLKDAGFHEVSTSADFAGAPYVPASSGGVVVTAVK